MKWLTAKRRDLVIDPGISAEIRHYVRQTQLRTWIAVGSTTLLLGVLAYLRSLWGIGLITNMLLVVLGILLVLTYCGVLHMMIVEPMRKRKLLLEAKRAFWLESGGLVSSLYRSQTEKINERGGEHKKRLHVRLFLLIAEIVRRQAVIDSMDSLADTRMVQARRDAIEAIIESTTNEMENYLSPE